MHHFQMFSFDEASLLNLDNLIFIFAFLNLIKEILLVYLNSLLRRF